MVATSALGNLRKRILMELGSMRELEVVRYDDTAVLLNGSHSDIALRFSVSEFGVRVNWKIAVREEMPGLRTWWASWVTSHDSADCALEVMAQLKSSISRIDRFIQEHGGE